MLESTTTLKPPFEQQQDQILEHSCYGRKQMYTEDFVLIIKCSATFCIHKAHKTLSLPSGEEDVPCVIAKLDWINS